MAQTILEIYAPANNLSELEDEEAFSTRWSGVTTDVLHGSSKTRDNMERDLKLLVKGDPCWDATCDFASNIGSDRSNTWRLITLPLWMTASILASSRTTATKHGRQKHLYDKILITEVDQQGRKIECWLVDGLGYPYRRKTPSVTVIPVRDEIHSPPEWPPWRWSAPRLETPIGYPDRDGNLRNGREKDVYESTRGPWCSSYNWWRLLRS